MASQSQSSAIPSVNPTQTQTYLPDVRLETVPLEVLLQITRHLKTPDYCNFRLINNHIEEKLFNAFAREFFTKRQFFLMEPSLQVLVDISKSRLAGTLTHVILGIERPSSSLGVANNQHAQIYHDYVAFMNSGQDVDLLAEAFSKLPSLDTVGMRDFNSRTRFRDSPRNEWRSYGANTYEKEMGQRLEMISQYEVMGGIYYADKVNYLSRIFLSLLRSLGKSGARPSTIEAILREVSLHDQSFNLAGDILPCVQPVLEQLKSILLDINSESPSPVDRTSSFNTTISSYNLRKFLALTPNLEHLRLNFGRYRNKDDMKSFLSWLSAPVVTSSTTPNLTDNDPPPTINLSKLKQLDIGSLQIEAPVLLTLVKKFKSSLKIFSCNRVTLLNTDMTNPRKKVNLWAKFFDDLSRTNIELTAINMRELRQGRFRHVHQLIERNIIFKDSRRYHEKERKWAGTTSESALRDFKAQVDVQWFQSDLDESGSEPPSEQSDNDEEDEENEEDDDIDDDAHQVSAVVDGDDNQD